MRLNDLYRADLDALNDLFDKLNERFFENTLSKPVITIQGDRKSTALSRFTPWESWQAGEDNATEINISANLLDSEPLDKATALLREMCCLYAYQNNVKVFTRGGTYLNKRFKDIAEMRGLTVEQRKKNVYTETKLTAEARKIIEPLLSGFQRLKRVEGVKGSDKKPSSTRKYACPKCKKSARATKAVNILCIDCNCRMIE